MEDNRANDVKDTSAGDPARDPEDSRGPSKGSSATAATAPDPSDVQRERDEFKDLLLRKSAEFDNYRKRVERDRQAVSEAAAASMIEELLPLVDDMERALKAEAGSDAESYRRGVQLILDKLTDTLRKRGVRPIEAVGAEFDPYYHQAVAHEHAEGKHEGEIIEEFRRGYMLGDRLLRPSMVKVAKG